MNPLIIWNEDGVNECIEYMNWIFRNMWIHIKAEFHQNNSWKQWIHLNNETCPWWKPPNDDTKANSCPQQARKHHIGALTKNCQRPCETHWWNSPSQENVLAVWMMQVWLNGGGLQSEALRWAKSNESVCGWCWGTIREGTPPDLTNLCWDVISSVRVEWVPARCSIRTNGEKSRWQMSAS